MSHGSGMLKNIELQIWFELDTFWLNTHIKVDYESNIFTVVLSEVFFYIADFFELMKSDVWTFVNGLEYVTR